MHGTHDPILVALSLLIAVAAAYTALDLVGPAPSARERRLWSLLGAVVLGAGIWSMHFVGMLALTLPVPVSYDPVLTAVSLLLPIVVIACGFLCVDLWSVSSQAAWLGVGAFMGGGICAMHYAGMAAIRGPVAITYAPSWVAASVLVAVGAAAVALWLTSRPQRARTKLAGAACMGLAITGMHYTAMHAAHFDV